jgi:hypothetical protein
MPGGKPILIVEFVSIIRIAVIVQYIREAEVFTPGIKHIQVW